MSKQLSIHLFNCDRTYKLKVVEDWLEEGGKTTNSELGIDLNVESHDFSLSEMTQLSDKTIPVLKMDAAVFAVHAHESRLSINEENAGIGYAKLYRALLKKTGKELSVNTSYTTQIGGILLLFMMNAFILGNLSEIEPKYTGRKCLRSESDLVRECSARLVGMG